MIHRRISPEVPRLPGRAGLLIGATLWLLLSSGPAAHADDRGLLQDPAPSILEAATQAVEPVVQTAATAVPPPEEQAVAPSVQQALEPAVTAADEAVEPAVKAAEHAVGPGSKVVDGAVRSTVEPADEAVEPAFEPAVEPSVKSVPIPAEPRTAKQSRSKTADPTHRADLATRATSRTWILHDQDAADDEDQAQDPGLWALTNALMHQMAGDPLPGWINAGLPPGAVSVRTPWTAPLLLGLLGFLCLILARRRLR